MKKTVLVVGCGIGGPVASLSLQRAGFTPVLYEARAEGAADSAGSFLNLASNGLDALHALGVPASALAEGFPTPRMVMFSGTGKRLGEVANGLALADGTVSLTIARAALHRALQAQLHERGLQVVHGKRLRSAKQQGAQVVARFEDGSEALGDVLVGADGLHSVVRELVAPDAPAPRYTGQLSVGGVAPQTKLQPTPGAYHMVFGRRAFLGFSVLPGGEAWWFANLAQPQLPSRDDLAAISPAAWKERLLALFADDAGPARALISATVDAPVAYPIFDMPPVPRWSREGMVLLGDAAHATSPNAGQGAAMAIEDAVVLGQCLRDVPDTVQALRTYEGLRRARVEKVVRYSARVGSSKVPGPVGRALRDAMMPLALKLFAGSCAQTWLYAHHLDWQARVHPLVQREPRPRRE